MRGRILNISGARRRRLSLALLAAPLALGAGGCAYRNSPFSQYAPMLWRVERPDTGGRAWLFGSIHAGLERFYPLPEAVETAWRESHALAIELDVRARWKQLRGAFAQRAQLPGEQTIDALVGEPTARAIRTHFGYDPVTWKRLRRLQPWALSINMANPNDGEHGMQSRFGIDRFFIDRARQRSMPIVELEQAGEQVEAFAGGSMESQLTQLVRRFDMLRRWDPLLSDTVEAWRLGSEARLSELKQRAWGATSDPDSPRQRMFANRDRRMAVRLRGLLTQPHTVFTVVGAFHLAGGDALTGMLEDLGLRVERYQYQTMGDG